MEMSPFLKMQNDKASTIKSKKILILCAKVESLFYIYEIVQVNLNTSENIGKSSKVEITIFINNLVICL